MEDLKLDGMVESHKRDCRVMANLKGLAWLYTLDLETVKGTSRYELIPDDAFVLYSSIYDSKSSNNLGKECVRHYEFKGEGKLV